MSTFTSGAAPEPGDHVIPHASIVLPCFNEADHVLLDPLKVLMPPALFLLVLGFGQGIYDLAAHPLHVANDTILIFVTGMILASMALLADLIVRSRADT